MGGKPSPLDQSTLLHGLVLPRSVLMIPFLNGTISRHLSSGQQRPRWQCTEDHAVFPGGSPKACKYANGSKGATPGGSLVQPPRKIEHQSKINSNARMNRCSTCEM